MAHRVAGAEILAAIGNSDVERICFLGDHFDRGRLVVRRVSIVGENHYG